ncbi:Cullin repeat-like-containing domain protein [Phaeosphaeria sp. MPI-PUGE-AT-0046c]|nr:Cullin repeat-like-containing domain protein [Phaeosphaeria sp. MPI-PUGE-AT-0046c]
MEEFPLNYLDTTWQTIEAGIKHYLQHAPGTVHLLRKELYGRLKQVLEIHLQEIQDEAGQHPNETLLAFYRKEWDQYENAARSINPLFRYLNRTWVKRENKEGRKHVDDVYTLHLVVWKEVVVASASADIADALEKAMKREKHISKVQQEISRNIKYS